MTDTGERARASPAKAENYLEEDRLSFEGLDLCTECLTKIREKERERFHQPEELVQNLLKALGIEIRLCLWLGLFCFLIFPHTSAWYFGYYNGNISSAGFL